MNFKFKSLLVLLVMFCFTAHAQQVKTISGKVVSKSDGLPLPGVNIIIVGTTKGESTDFDGNYQIEAKVGDVLQFSFVSYKNQLITVGESSIINLSMEDDENALDEVVVIGYGTQKRKNLTGAITKLKNEKLDQIAVARVDEALVGQISGVQIAATEGEAGSAPTIRIRGTGSITSDAGPLVVIDGVIVDSEFLSNLDMNDVESFSVLKDASSGAIYGSRGANGVIIISTKNGKEGKTQFSYNAFTGFKEGIQQDKIYFSVADWAEREQAATGALSAKTQYKLLLGVDEDWQDIIIDGGKIESHSFAARGGSQRTKFSTSLNYLHDEGVLLTDDFKRYTMRLKVDSKVGKNFKLGAQVAPSYSRRRRFDGSTHDILRQPPWLPLFHNEQTIQFVDRANYPDVQVGDYAVQRHFDNYDLFNDGGQVDISTTSNTNPGAKVLERDRNDYRFRIQSSIFGEYKIIDGLKLRSQFNADYQHRRQDRWQGTKASRNGVAATQLDISNETRIYVALDNTLTYNKKIGKHDINAVVGASAESFAWDFESARGIGYTSDFVQTLNAASLISLGFSERYEERLFSLFARANYAYNDKYLLSVSARRDGFSAFGPDRKYGVFPSVSAGWLMTNESFLEDNEVVNYLKVRASYGVTGNNAFDIGSGTFRNQINSYPFQTLLGPSSSSFDNAIANGFNPLNIANPDLGWERSIEINPGIDFGLFNDKITGSFDYYTRTSDDLLLDVPVPEASGFSNALQNRGEVQNRGWELELRTQNIRTQKFQWNTTFIASRNENELLDFAESNGQIGIVDNKRAAEWINLVGNPISSYYGWVVDQQIDNQYIRDPWERVGQTNREVIVKDLNGDGLIDDDDKTILGDPYPDFVWSIGNEIKIGDFDMNFLFQGSHGAEIRNIGDQYIFRHFGSSSVADSGALVNDGVIPNESFVQEKIFTNSIIQDASYIALRTVNLGYNFPTEVAEKLSLTKLRVYLTGQNLFYWFADDYTGLNPESINNTSPTTYGYQRVGSPINRTITLGINVGF